jgi:hypothetical protein
MNGVTTAIQSGAGIPGLFDSQILFKGTPSTRVENGFLLLRQRVNLYRFDGDVWWEVKKGKRTDYQCQPWPDKEWLNFLFVFRYICEDYWNRQHALWFQPPATFTALNVPFAKPTHRPNLQSAYEMDVRDFKRNPHQNPHMTVQVLRLKDSEFDYRSYVNRSTGDVVLTNRDIRETNRDYWWGPFFQDSFVQITALHENAHMLGEDHVGRRLKYPECGGKDSNGDICYGRNAHDKGELSGVGLRWVQAYDRPWRSRIALHTNTDENAWVASRQAVAPQPLAP